MGEPARGRAPWALPGVLAGIGVAGTLDEVVLHQLLGWHHLYDRGSETAGLVSDGLFHLLSTGLLVAAAVLLWRRRPRLEPGWGRGFTGALLAGAGGFNLYDGTVQHKLLGLHQVRPQAADQLPYDIAFIGTAVVVLVAGLALLRRTERAAR